MGWLGFLTLLACVCVCVCVCVCTRRWGGWVWMHSLSVQGAYSNLESQLETQAWRQGGSVSVLLLLTISPSIWGQSCLTLDVRVHGAIPYTDPLTETKDTSSVEVSLPRPRCSLVQNPEASGHGGASYLPHDLPPAPVASPQHHSCSLPLYIMQYWATSMLSLLLSLQCPQPPLLPLTVFMPEIASLSGCTIICHNTYVDSR